MASIVYEACESNYNVLKHKRCRQTILILRGDTRPAVEHKKGLMITQVCITVSTYMKQLFRNVDITLSIFQYFYQNLHAIS